MHNENPVSLTTLLGSMRPTDSMRPSETGFEVSIPPDWLQGRAIYGGLSAALCVRAAHLHVEELPTLRSAQITFFAPPGAAEVSLTPRLVRQGRSASFVHVDMHSVGAPVMQATLCFGAARPSDFSAQWLPAPAMLPLEGAPPFFEAGPAPNFAQHFNSRWAGGQIPASGAPVGDVSVWLQHKDEAARTSIEGLVCMADALPPAAMTMFRAFAPASSVTWLLDIVGPLRSPADSWWLARSTTQSVGEGYSTQKMTLWNQNGEPVIIAQQNCAIFA